MLATDASRLTIERLVLINFKSYAGVQQIGPLHKSFTSIVGPNGSGKSNVIDALLFVFGFRAKKMRQDRLSRLIHKSEAFKNLDSCTVEVHFEAIVDNVADGSFTVVPNSSLVVSRTAYENNSSKYQINGSSASYTEVVTLLKNHGIDLDHNRFLILQGEVELIAQMKPKAPNENEEGLLEYLEDIIGTKKYKQPIEEAHKSLEELDEQRAGELSRLKIVEKDYQSYKERAYKVEAAIEIENSLVRQKNMLYQRLAYTSEVNVELFESIISSLQGKLAAVNSGVGGAAEKITNNKRELEEALKSYEEASQAHASLANKLEEISHKDLRMQERRKQLKSQVRNCKKDLESGRREEAELERWLKEIHPKDLAEFQRQITTLEEAEKEESQRLELLQMKLKDSTKELQAELDVNRRKLLPFIEKESDIKARKQRAGVKAAALKKKRQEFTERHFSTKEELYALETQLASINFTKSQKEGELTVSSASFNDKSAQLGRITDELSKHRMEHGRLMSDHALLEQTFQHNGSRSHLLQALKEEQIAGRLCGVYGRLGDLGSISPTYDVAVTTACAQLNDIVVASVESAQKCIEFLRQRKLGRARFICLNKMATPKSGSFTNPNNLVSRLYDLIEPSDTKFAPAFYYALQDTLVAPDIKTAQQVAFGGSQRYRVVTVDGKLIDKSGTMSGGGSRPLRGGMSSVAPASVARNENNRLNLQRQIEQVEETIQKLESQQQMLEGQVSQRLREVQQVDTELKKLYMDSESVKVRQVEVKHLLEDMADGESGQGLTQSEHETLNKCEELLSELQEEFNQISEPLATMKSSIALLERQIAAQGGKELSAAIDKVSQIHVELRKKEQELAKLEVTQTTKTRKLSGLRDDLFKLNGTIAELESEQQKLKAEMEAQLDDAMNVKLAMDEINVDSFSARLESLKTTAEALEKEREREEEQTLDWQNQLKERGAELAAEVKKVTHWQLEREKLQLVDVGLSMNEAKLAALEVYSRDELEQMDKDELAGNVAVLEAQVEANRPDLSVLEDFRVKTDSYLERARQVDNVTKLRDNARKRYEQARKARMEAFLAGFTRISESLKEMYQMITMGGNAELEFVDSMDPFSEGIVFSVMPPKKTWKNISNLSGGEKTLSSLALVFALHQYKPTPIYVMDEIDAALDFKNVSIVASYIKERTQNAQFLIISLRNNMFELADRLVGIYKKRNCTKSVTINPSNVAKMALVRIAAARLQMQSKDSAISLREPSRDLNPSES